MKLIDFPINKINSGSLPIWLVKSTFNARQVIYKLVIINKSPSKRIDKINIKTLIVLKRVYGREILSRDLLVKPLGVKTWREGEPTLPDWVKGHWILWLGEPPPRLNVYRITITAHCGLITFPYWTTYNFGQRFAT